VAHQGDQQRVQIDGIFANLIQLLSRLLPLALLDIDEAMHQLELLALGESTIHFLVYDSIDPRRWIRFQGDHGCSRICHGIG
jgi:hypothetical protein